jgi:hypothetical protein
MTGGFCRGMYVVEPVLPVGVKKTYAIEAISYNMTKSHNIFNTHKQHRFHHTHTHHGRNHLSSEKKIICFHM